MKRIIRNNNTISGALQDELVMMDIEKGMYFSLNPVATRMWELLEKPLFIEELVALLMEEYEIGEAQCKTDVEEHLREMLKLGLVLEVND